jgi:hypothetical protein
MATVSTWDEQYIDNITFLRTYRLLVNKFRQGRENTTFEPQIESMDIPMALWAVGAACIVANMRGYENPGVAGVYAAFMFYIPLQIAFYLLLSNGTFRMGSPAMGYTAFPAAISVYLAASVMFLMATTSDDEPQTWSITDVVMGVTLALAGSYMSWVSTATGGVTANYATNIRRALFDPVPT